MKVIFFLSIATLFFSCTSSPRFYTNKSEDEKAITSRYFTDDDNKVDTLRNLPLTVEAVVGYASFYAHDFDGKKTANGETYNMYELTAAHRTYPFNTMIRVTNLANDKSVIVRINDRGPFVEGRIIDLSLGAAIQLGMSDTGILKVKLEIIEWGIN